MAIPHTPKHSL